MKQKLEKISEIRNELMVELEHAEILLRICEDELLTEDLRKKDLSLISRIALKSIKASSKMVENIGLVLIMKNDSL